MNIKPFEIKTKDIIRLIFAFILFVFLGTVSFFLVFQDKKSFFLEQKGFRALYYETSLFDSFLSAPKRLLKSKQAYKIFLELDHLDLAEILNIRKRALKKGYLLKKDGDKKYFNGQLKYKNQTYEAKVRLKGDKIDHVKTDKLSFRINLKNSKTFFGMNKFSLQSPITRSFYGEPVILKTMQKYDILTPRFMLVNLFVNKRDLGVMALEEFFSFNMLEKKSFEKSPILYFNENPYWQERQTYNRKHSFYGNSAISEVEFYQDKKTKNQMQAKLKKAYSLLDKANKGLIKAHQAFDIKKLSDMIAICQMFGSSHGLWWINLKFYYNPKTKLLEPISFDNDPFWARARDKRDVLSGKIFLSSLLKNDDKFIKQYQKSINKLYDDFENGLFKYIKSQEKIYKSFTDKEFYLISELKKEHLKKRLIYAKTIFSKKEHINSLEDRKTARYKGDKDLKNYSPLYGIKARKYKKHIEIYNTTPFNAKITDIYWEKDDKKQALENKTIIGKILEPTKYGGHPKYLNIKHDNKNYKKQDLYVISKVKDRIYKYKARLAYD